MVESAPLDPQVLKSLKSAAAEASRNAYAPYSQFAVGAAVLSDGGRIYRGCNVENASFGLTICAERAAVCQMIVNGERSIRAVLVYTPTETPTLPCGACRQVIAAFGPRAEVFCVCDHTTAIHEMIDSLLPHSFDSLPKTAND